MSAALCVGARCVERREHVERRLALVASGPVATYASRARAELEASIGRPLSKRELATFGKVATDKSRPAAGARKALEGLRELRESTEQHRWILSHLRWVEGDLVALASGSKGPPSTGITRLVAHVDTLNFLHTGRAATPTELGLLMIVVTGPTDSAESFEDALETAINTAKAARRRRGLVEHLGALREMEGRYRASVEAARQERERLVREAKGASRMGDDGALLSALLALEDAEPRLVSLSQVHAEVIAEVGRTERALSGGHK